MLDFYKSKYFMEKGYGVSLLSILYGYRQKNKLVYLSKLYEELPQPKPQYNAFRKYIDRLEDVECIVMIDSRAKKTRKCVKLSDDFILNCSQYDMKIISGISQLYMLSEQNSLSESPY